MIIKQLGIQPYEKIWQKMQDFTEKRTTETEDEIWFVQHPSIFTQGTAGKAEHLLKMTEIPVVQSDRGGQITYHGLGQIVMYVLIDIKRLKAKRRDNFSVRDLVSALENTVINTLKDYNVESRAKSDAPGVYVGEKKICSLGLRIRKGCSFHGLAFNVNMDLTPFQYINPCGYQGLEMCQLADFVGEEEANLNHVAEKLASHFLRELSYNNATFF